MLFVSCGTHPGLNLERSYGFPIKSSSKANILIEMIQGIFALELDLKDIHSFAPSLTQDAFHSRPIASGDLN